MRLLVALALTLLVPPQIALAESPSPPPPTAPPPRPSPSVAPEVEVVDAAVADQMRRAIAATSLAERIDAQRRLAAAERDLLVREISRIRAEQAAAEERSLEVQRKVADKRATLDRLLEETYRSSRITPLEAFLRRGSIVDLLVHVDDLARLSAKQREVVEELRELERDVAREREALARREADVVALSSAVAAKDAALARLGAWADALVARGTASDARIELLRALADDVAREHEESERLITEIARRAGEPPPTPGPWSWPLDGPVTQEFGPTALVLEPPATYRGVAYPHFHDGLDIAAALGSPVRAVARGRVAFVGRLGDAMAVVIVHADGLISLYGHLDDAALRPTVRPGDVVEPGQTIGSVGLTGLTTGPHLHFGLRKGTEPVDPRIHLPGRPGGALGSP